MATLPGSYVRKGLSTITRVNQIIDALLTSLVEFRQITIHHERGTYLSTNVWKFSYPFWNPDYPTQVFYNNNSDAIVSTLYTINQEYGQLTTTFASQAGDSIMVTYNFDYFPIHILESFIFRSVDVINTGTVGPTSNYTISDAPGNWDGIIADLAYAMCMEKLILDYDLWKGRLIFAIGPQALSDGGGDIISQLTTLKQNAEERAFKAFDNPKFKAPPYLAGPTRAYYEALMVGGSSRYSAHGIDSYGKLRGWKSNKFMGRVLGP